MDSTKQLKIFNNYNIREYVVAFKRRSSPTWQFGTDYNSLGRIRYIRTESFFDSFKEVFNMEEPRPWVASVHDNFKTLLTRPIIDNSTQIVIYQVGTNFLTPVVELDSALVIRLWCLDNI